VLRRCRAITASLKAWANSRPSPQGESERGAGVRRWLAWSGVVAIAVLLVSVAAGNHQRYAPGFDVLDEGAHYDYVLDLTHGHVPVSGERLSQSTMRMLSCLGEVGFPPRGCGVKERIPASFPAGGYSYESVAQPPLGYLPYLLTAQPNDSPRAALETARWGGFVWSVVAAGLLVWVGWLADLSLLELCAVLAVCLLSPVEVHAAATVTNDSAGVVAGAAVLGTFLAARRRETAMAGIGLIVGLLVGFMKGLFVVAPFVVLVSVLIADLGNHRKPRRADFWPRYGCALSMFVGAAVALPGWLLIQDARATVSPSVVLHALQGFSTSPYLRPSTILAGTQNALSDLISYAPAPLYWIWNLTVYGSLVGLLVLQGPVGRPRMRVMATAIFVGMIALAIVFPWLNFIEGHYDFNAQVRYALPLLPLVGFVIARSLRIRGLLLIGIALPALAVIDQLVAVQF
jgi:hypothetical protein